MRDQYLFQHLVSNRSHFPLKTSSANSPPSSPSNTERDGGGGGGGGQKSLINTSAVNVKLFFVNASKSVTLHASGRLALALTCN